MWGFVTRRLPRCHGQVEAGEAAETESGEGDGGADCEEGRVGSEEAGGVRAGAGETEERGDGCCEAYKVEMTMYIYVLMFATNFERMFKGTNVMATGVMLAI